MTGYSYAGWFRSIVYICAC